MSKIYFGAKARTLRTYLLVDLGLLDMKTDIKVVICTTIYEFGYDIF